MIYNEFIQNIIISRGQWNIPEGCMWENHHIIPLCIGGEPKKYNHYTRHQNLVGLLPREHYVAHMLLAIENPTNSSLVNAGWAMNNGNPSGITDYEIAAEEYELSKKLFIENLSKTRKGKSQEELFGQKMIGEKHPQYGKHPGNYRLTKEISDSVMKMSISSKGKHNNSGENNPMHGKKHTVESKLKMSISKLGIPNPKRQGIDPHSGGAGQPSKSVICIETGKIYNRVNDTPSPSHISSCCRGKQEKCLGYHGMYLEDYNKIKDTLVIPGKET